MVLSILGFMEAVVTTTVRNSHDAQETAQAAKDLKAHCMMPIHWGAFALAMHPWSEPVVRVQKKATELSVLIIVPW